tara:strand:+ start:2330 stop:2962 length:633 start_codon:yes stop_codon:yes gene_type:complete
MKKLLITAAIIACGSSFASAPIYKAAAPKSLMCPAYGYGIQLGSAASIPDPTDSVTPVSVSNGGGIYVSKDCVQFSTLVGTYKESMDAYTESGSTTAKSDIRYYYTTFELAYAKPVTQNISAGLGLSGTRYDTTNDIAKNVNNTPYGVGLSFLLSQKLTDRFAMAYSFPLVLYSNNGQTANTSSTTRKSTAVNILGAIFTGTVSMRYSLA